MFLYYLMVDKPHKVFVEAYGRNSFWMKVVNKKIKVAAFSPLVLKSNIFEKIKYAQKNSILRNFKYKNIRSDTSISKFLTIKGCTFEFQ